MADKKDLDAAMRKMLTQFDPDKAQGLNVWVQINATGEGGGPYMVHLADGKAKVCEGVAQKPNVALQVKADDWIAMVNDQMDATMAFMMGKVKISGDLALMVRFQQMFGK